MEEFGLLSCRHFLLYATFVIIFINKSTADVKCDPLKLKGTGFNMTCFGYPRAAPVSCNTPLPPNGTVVIGCQEMYDMPKNTPGKVNGTVLIVCQKDGSWNNKRPNCYPVCGKPTERKSVEKNKTVEIGHSPWHVAVYKTKPYPEDKSSSVKYPELICGGSIIGENLIVSAAHCFRDAFHRYYDPSYFEIVVAKLTWDFNKQDHLLTKHFKIKDIFRSDNFSVTSYGTFGGDIALLETEIEISFNKFVQPVCVDWVNTRPSSDSQFSEGSLVGWGGLKNESYGQILHETKLKSVSKDECKAEINPESVSNLNYDDKFCTKSIEGIARPGDSGGGLVYFNPFYQSYYLSGIASSKDELKSQLALFTDLSSYVDWIDSVKYEIAIKNKKKISAKRK